MKLRDGSEVAVRPIEPGDKQRILDAFERLSDESRYRRFFSPITRLTDGQLAYLTEIDHESHEALVALDENDHLVGVARYVRVDEPENAAEVAVTVVDDWQGLRHGHRAARRPRPVRARAGDRALHRERADGKRDGDGRARVPGRHDPQPPRAGRGRARPSSCRASAASARP